jgi:hypothetical protein
MKKILSGIVSLVVFFGSAQIGFSQAPTFLSVVVAAGNGSAVVTFDQNVTSDAAGTQPLLAAQFSVAISASSAGGTVSAGAVTLSGVTHALGQSTATISFTISGVADGSEVLTVKAANATSIYSTTGTVTPMAGTETVTGNLKDLLAPTISISAPSASNANGTSSITYTITYTGANAVTLANSDVTINPTGDASASLTVTGSGSTTRTITLSSFTGNGTVGISIAGSTGSDLAGNNAVAAGPSATVNVDNIAPTISIGAPSAGNANGTSSITYTVTYTGANAVTLANGDLTVNSTGDASAIVNVTGSGSTTRTITLSSFTGDGTVGISIAGSTASDLAGNNASAEGPSATVNVDNIAPTISIGAPSASTANGTSSITYTVTYAGADAVTLANANVTINPTGSASASVTVTGSGSTTRTITLSSFTGNGTVGISIAGSTASDLAGNNAAAAGPSATVNVDTSPPTISIGAPSAGNVNNASSITYTVTYTGADAVALANGDVAINPTGGASANVNVTGSGLTTRTITLSSFTGSGTVGISIAGSTASDLAGNNAAAAGPSATVNVDNTAPTVSSITLANASPNNLSSVNFTVTFSEPVQASTVTSADFTISPIGPTGTSIGSISPSTGNATIFTVTVNTGSGDGTIGLDRPSTSSVLDVLGNDGTGQTLTGATYTIDKTPPVVSSIARASGSPSNASSVNFTVTFNELVQASTVNSADFTIVASGATGTSFGTISPSSGTATVFTIPVNTGSGNGTIGLDRLAGSSVTDAVGNVGTGQALVGQVYTIDKTPPTILSITNSIATIYSGSLVQTVTVTYNETMNTSVAPPITINSGGVNWGTQTNSGGTNGWVGAVYTATFTHNGTQQMISGISTSVGVGGAQDAALNANTGAATSASFNLDTQNPTVVSIIRASATPTNATSVSYTATFSEAVQATGITVADFSIAATGPIGTSITAISPSSGNSATFTVTVNAGTGDGSIGLDWISSGNATDIPGNVGTGQTLTGQVYTIDRTPPVVASIVSSSTLKGFGTQAIAANSVSFLVTFSETNTPLTGIDLDASDFTVIKDASISYTTAAVSAVSNPAQRMVTINNIAGTGRISLGLTDNNSILDAASNPLAGAADGSLVAAYSGAQFYTIVLPEPSASVTNFVPSSNTNSVTVTWNDAVAPATQATHYLVRIKKQTAAFAIPTFVNDTNDGADYTDTDFTDGTLASYVAYESTLPTGTITFNGLSSGTAYNVEVYPLTYTANYPAPSSGNWDYRFTSPLTGNATTTTAANGTVSLVSSAASISSLETALSGASTPQVNATQHFRFSIKDDGATNSVDDADFKFSTIVIREGTGSANSISDWTQAIASAELSDGVNTPVSVTTSAVTTSPNTITFNVNSSTLGFIADDASKTYTLRIALKTSLGGTLPSTIDGKNFEFRVDQGSFATFYDNVSNSEASSTLAVVSLESGNANNQVAVIASKLDFNTEPQAQIGVGIRFSLVPLSGRPVVNALDPNNNLDLGFTQTGTIDTPTTNLSPSLTSASFSGGVLSLSNLQLNAAGISEIRVQSLGVTAANSSNVTAVISNKTTITAGAAAEPATISSLATALSGAILPQQNAIQNFDFTITDDVAADITTFIDNDGLPTLLTQISINQGTGNDPFLADWTKVIAGAELRTSGVLVGSSAIYPDSIRFSGIANSVLADPGYIADGGSRTYQLRIFLRTSVDATIADDIDNKDFVFSLDQSTVSIGSANTTSTLSVSTTDSGDGNNTITVLPTRFAFATAAYNTTAIGQSYDSPLSPLPIVKVQDPNGNRDINYAGSPSVAAASPSTYTLANTALVNTTGTIDFNAGFQVTSAGNGPSGSSTTFTVSDGTLTSAVSVPVTFSYSGSSDIIRQTVGFAYESDILYATPANQVTSITNSTGTEIERFSLRDAAGASDTDGTPTVLNEIVLNVTNWQNVRKLALFDGASKLSEVDVPTSIVTSGANIGNITFTGFTFSAGDDSNKDLSVRASFNRLNVVDNQIVTVRIVSVKAATTASSQFSNTTPTGIQSAPTNQENQMEVVATVIDYTTLPTNASVYVPVAITAEARDGNANRDLDYNGTITSFSTTPGSPAFVTTNDPSGDFTNGVYNFPVNFQFTTGNNANTTLVLESGAASTNNSVNATALSSATSAFNASINVLTSFDSRLAGDPSYSFQPDITYIDYQATDITNSTTSYEIARFLVRDGDPTKTIRDTDGAATILQDFDVELYTGLTKLPVRRIGIYVAGSEVAELTPSALVSGKSTTSFTGVNIAAPDEQDVAVSIRVSFLNNATDVLDNDAITLRISSATAGNGSNFLTTAGFIGGVNGGLQTPSTTSGGAVANKIEVNATRLDFTTQPPNLIAGINQPFAPPIVEARDAFGLLDLDYDAGNTNAVYQNASVSSSAQLAKTSYPFALGVLSLPTSTILSNSFYYTSIGDGTLTITANGLSSNTAGSTQCQPIRVMNVGASLNTSGVIEAKLDTDNVKTASIKGGRNNVVIFGITFTAANSSINEPSLQKFTFTFDFPYKTASKTILQNFKVRDLNGDVTLQGATLTQGSSKNNTDLDLITVDWGSNPPPPLFDANTGNPSPNSYFLICDVSVTADINTQRLTPQFIAGGYGSDTAGNFVVSQGSASGNVIGTRYQFASTRPPTLLTASGSGTSPFNAQLNVDPNIGQIDLAFDVEVWSLDGKIELYKRTTNQKIADLTAINGNYSIDKTVAPAKPISFKIPASVLPLQADSLYYIRIAKGSSGNNIDSGISDNALNFFGGISYNGALYFKVSSPNPPKLLDIKPSFINSTVGSFSVKFDQQGTGYFLVLDPSKYATKPTNADIKSPAAFLLANPNSVAAFNSFAISQVSVSTNTPAQFVSFGGSFLPDKTYDVWVYAENNATPNPIPTSSPYGGVGSRYASGGTGPTLKITAPPLRNNRLFNQPIYSVCPNSNSLLTEPIVLTEGAAADFTSSSTQDFNILLPTGFQFINKPKVTLNGSDFDQTSLSISLVNNSIATVSYKNQGMGSIDNIVISDIYIKSASGSVAGDIIRFAGSARLNNSGSKLGSISTEPLGSPNFDNSFSKDNDFSSFGFNKEKDIIAAIPDNYQDKDPTISGFIRLIPKLENANDYGTDVFSGTAITNDLLSLTSAPLNAPFDITITHTDLNGCVSTTRNQYYVYDHNFPISKNLGRDINNVPIGTKQALVNPNFPTGFVAGGSFPDSSLPRLNYTDVAGYRLIDLYADLPALYAVDSPKDTTQIMRGRAWRTLVKQIPVAVNTIPSNSNNEGYFKDFQWDYTRIINAIASDNTKKITIADFTNSNTKPDANKNYWKGGSLGKIQFTGRYQSTADFQVFIPLRQEVELFFAPVPIIDIATSTAPSSNDNNTLVYCEDGVIPSVSGASPITFNGLPNALAGTSVGSFSLENASDGLIFWAKNLDITTTNGGANVGGNTQVTLSKPVNLKANDKVNVFGYTRTGTSISQSKRVLAVSSDFKTITLDYAFSPSNTITHLAVTVSVNGFVDNDNGTSILTPDLLRKALTDNPNNNGYQNIRLGYTFKENISPVSGTGYITLRIAPNPTVTFSAASQSSVNVLAGKNDAYCENRPVEFTSDNKITPVPGVTNTVDKFTWDFGDPLNSVSPNVNSITDASKGTLLGTTSQNIGVAEKPLHVYTSFTTYTATHVVTSNYGCKSKPYTANLKVGAIPTVAFDFRGVSTGSDFYFKLTNGATATSTNDGIKQLTWDFGDANRRDITTAFTDSVKYNYSRAGLYNASLKLTSTIGCINTVVPQRLLVLPLVSGTKKFDFETDQQWFDIAAGPIASSWARGKPAAGSTLPFELKPENGQGIWKTNLSGPYNSGERSYLFSPAFDISKVAKPLVSFDSYYDFKVNNVNVPDGVVLQFSIDVYNIVDSRKTWYTLGTYDGVTPSGYNWYNSQGLASKPGLQTIGDYGWSGNSEGWKESKHTLSYPIAVGLDNAGRRIFISPEKSKRLVFRFALAGVDGVNVRGNGFALDNFSIGERTRMVVIESFSNLGNRSANEKSESDLLKTLTNRTTTGNVKTGFDQQDVLNINYHIAFPEKDPFNLDNPDDPSARALFYNVKESPRSRLDGFNGLKDDINIGDPLFSSWTSKYDLQALKLADAAIELSGILSDAKTGITIPVKVTALTDLDSANTVLHVGVLERSIAFSALNTANQQLIATENRAQVNSEFILKKMLPNATGRKFTKKLKANESITFAPLTWVPDPAKLYLPANDLYVFAFVQNSKTGEIYQAQVSGVINDPNVVTGISELTAEDISIFPNPANKEFTIELPSVTTQKVEYQLFDQVGKVILTGSINESQRSKTINSEDFSNGIYIIQLNSGADNVIRKKVMVFKE